MPNHRTHRCLGVSTRVYDGKIRCTGRNPRFLREGCGSPERLEAKSRLSYGAAVGRVRRVGHLTGVGSLAGFCVVASAGPSPSPRPTPDPPTRRSATRARLPARASGRRRPGARERARRCRSRPRRPGSAITRCAATHLARSRRPSPKRSCGPVARKAVSPWPAEGHARHAAAQAARRGGQQVDLRLGLAIADAIAAGRDLRDDRGQAADRAPHAAASRPPRRRPGWSRPRSRRRACARGRRSAACAAGPPGR